MRSWYFGVSSLIAAIAASACGDPAGEHPEGSLGAGAAVGSGATGAVGNPGAGGTTAAGGAGNAGGTPGVGGGGNAGGTNPAGGSGNVGGTDPVPSGGGGATPGTGGTGAGGTTPGTGGSSGSGGSEVVMPPPGYYGFYPPTSYLSSEMADAAYQKWKTDYAVDCGGGTWSVKFNNDSVVSEGIGYGMLLAVGYDDRAAFDGFWAKYNQHANGNGVMDWRVPLCGSGTIEGGAATDAELDAAMALIQAECKWGGYASAAQSLLGKIRQHEIAGTGSGAILKPGDGWGGHDCTSPSYFSPGYYRAFADFTGDGFWDEFAGATYGTLNSATHPSTGLVPDFYGNNCGGKSTTEYKYDAARTPWRIATDFVWWNTPQAQTWLQKIMTWASAIGPGNIKDGYTLDGNAISNYVNSAFVGGFATGAMAFNQETVNAFALQLSRQNDDAYFQATLKPLYMLLLTGRFVKGC